MLGLDLGAYTGLDLRLGSHWLMNSLFELLELHPVKSTLPRLVLFLTIFTIFTLLFLIRLLASTLNLQLLLLLPLSRCDRTSLWIRLGHPHHVLINLLVHYNRLVRLYFFQFLFDWVQSRLFFFPYEHHVYVCFTSELLWEIFQTIDWHQLLQCFILRHFALFLGKAATFITF